MRGVQGGAAPREENFGDYSGLRSNFELYGYGCAEPGGSTATASRRRPIYGYGQPLEGVLRLRYTAYAGPTENLAHLKKKDRPKLALSKTSADQVLCLATPTKPYR